MARLRAENEAEERGDSLVSSTSAAEGGNVGTAAKKKYVPIPEYTTKSTNGNSNDNNNEDEDEDDDDDDGQAAMMQMMGFGGFGTTKNKAVADNQSTAAAGVVSKNKGRKYRQYMNRKGGFKSPFDKMN